VSDVLNLGCGKAKRAGAINLDVTAATSPDVVHDLNRLPWPFPDSTFREVHANDVVEHLEDTVKTFEELHRVCRPGGVVCLTVPHFSSHQAYADPTHRRVFTLGTFDYFTPGNPYEFYSSARFRILQRDLIFQPTLANKLVWRLARRWPEEYERRWAWTFPAWFISARLEAVKG
jgi:SAM-dependent methyltransferase